EKAAHRLELRTRGESTRRAPRTASFVAVPESTALMAAITPSAVGILEAPSHRELTRRIEWLCDRIRELRPKYLRRVLTTYPLAKPVAVAVQDVLDTRSRFSVRHHFSGDSPVRTLHGYSADDIPQL